MESFMVGTCPNDAFSITTGGNLLRSKYRANKNIYHASSYVPRLSQLKRKSQEYTTLKSWLPGSNNHYKFSEGLSTNQDLGRTYAIKASLGSSLESESHASHSESTLDSVKNRLAAYFKFSTPYPYTLITRVLNTICISFIAVEKLSDISPLFFMGLLKILIPPTFTEIYLNGINQLSDIEIDKINKPYLPLPSGKVSYTSGVVITASSLLLSFFLAWMIGSQPLIWNVSLIFLLWTAYSADVPLLRWKKHPILTAIIFLSSWGFILPISYFLHMQNFVFKRPTIFPRSLIFVLVFSSFYIVGLSFLKDIPDIEGDQAHGINSFSARFGPKRVFWICVSLFELALGVGVLMGATSSYLWSKIITVLGHAVLALVLWYHAKSVDLRNNTSTLSFYKLSWQLFCAQGFLIPFIR